MPALHLRAPASLWNFPGCPVVKRPWFQIAEAQNLKDSSQRFSVVPSI